MQKLSLVQRSFVKSLFGLSLVCIFLYVIRIIASDSFRYGFIPWNLSLIWIALFISYLTSERLKKVVDYKTLALLVLWIGFLPNTWYVLTDFVHVYPTGEVSQLYDIVLIASLVVVGFIAGFTSLFLVHKRLIPIIGSKISGYVMAGVLLISSFGIYLGRDLRWNTWDVISNPAGILVDLTDRIIDPLGHPRFITMTGLFFILLGSIYLGIWHFYSSVYKKEPTKRKR